MDLDHFPNYFNYPIILLLFHVFFNYLINYLIDRLIDQWLI